MFGLGLYSLAKAVENYTSQCTNNNIGSTCTNDSYCFQNCLALSYSLGLDFNVVLAVRNSTHLVFVCYYLQGSTLLELLLLVGLVVMNGDLISH
jgi:hypothetical protein